MGIIEAIAAFFKSIPVVADFLKWISDARTNRDERKNEVEALARKSIKDQRIDDAIAAVERLRQSREESSKPVSPPPGQLPPPDSAA